MHVPVEIRNARRPSPKNDTTRWREPRRAWSAVDVSPRRADACETGAVDPRTSVTHPQSGAKRPPTFVNRPRAAVNRPRTFVNRPRTAANRPRAAVNRPRTGADRPQTPANRPRTSVNLFSFLSRRSVSRGSTATTVRAGPTAGRRLGRRSILSRLLPTARAPPPHPLPRDVSGPDSSWCPSVFPRSRGAEGGVFISCGLFPEPMS